MNGSPVTGVIGYSTTVVVSSFSVAETDVIELVLNFDWSMFNVVRPKLQDILGSVLDLSPDMIEIQSREPTVLVTISMKNFQERYHQLLLADVR